MGRYPFPALLCSGMLLVAAGLKGVEVVVNPLAAGPILETRWELIAVMEAELLLGLALALGLYPTAVRRLALASFGLFAAVNLYQIFIGASSCGCFGAVRVHPASTLVLDLVALAALVGWRPGPVDTRPAASLTAVGLAGLALLAVAVAAPSTANPDDLDTPGSVAVLNPAEWVGEPFPLLDRLDGGTELRKAEWVVIFHRRGCDACATLLAELRLHGGERHESREPVRLACIEIPSNVTGHELPAACQRMDLRARRVWVMKAPTCVYLIDGHTEAVTSDVVVVRNWLGR